MKKEETVIEKKIRPSTPPHQSTDRDGWWSWYQEAVREMVSEGKSTKDIAKKLNIREDSVIRLLE